MGKLLATAVAVLTVLAVAVAAPAAAGGWAVTTLDPLTTTPAAGEPFEVGFTIRQHGRTPVTVDAAAILVTDAAGATTRFAATPQGVVGHHVATVEVSSGGDHTWAVDQGLGIQELGTLAVAGSTDAGTSGSPWSAPLFAVAAVLAALGLADLGRAGLARRRESAPA